VSSVDKERFVTSLARGLTVLKAFGRESPEMTLSQVAAATNLSPAVARRFLLTLVQLGYLSQVDRTYVLTPRVMELAASYLDSMNLSEIAQPHLQQIRDSTGDSVSLTALDGVDIIHLCHVQTERLLRFAVTPGSRVPAYVSGTGHAILAFEPESRLAEYFARAQLTPRTPRTVTSEAELRKRLRAAREDGYALVVDELDIGITVIGYPIMKDRAAVAGISCAIASGYLPVADFVASRLPLLEAASVRLQKELGRFPALMHSLDMSRPSGY
jgi:IclR family transcriptional regulator, pca regulon regulatory protein